MSLPSFSMKELLEAGIHFGHQVNRWNPKMQTYLFGERNGIHIIDLQQTVPLLNSALKMLRDIAASGGRILFVGTKRQAQKIIADTSVKCGQYFVNHRWLGGTLTNWNTISNSISRLKKYEEIINKEESGLTKKEMVGLTRQRDKLNLSLGGIKEMGGRPEALFVIDTNKEHIAVSEAIVLGIPVIGVLDSNSNPEGIDYPIPGNDDATRAISMYCRLAEEAISEGMKDSIKSSGKDLGELEGVLTEKIKVNTAEEKNNKTKNTEGIEVGEKANERINTSDQRSDKLIVTEIKKRKVLDTQKEQSHKEKSENNTVKKPPLKEKIVLNPDKIQEASSDKIQEGGKESKEKNENTKEIVKTTQLPEKEKSPNKSKNKTE